MTLDQMRLRLHLAHTEALAVQLSAARKWGDKSALATAAGLGVKELRNALRVVDDLVARGEA